MLPKGETIAPFVEGWLAQFERALTECDGDTLKTLFHPQSHWRDALAFTWRITTIEGWDAILSELAMNAARVKATGFKLAQNRTPPRQVTRAGTNAIEAIFAFETTDGRGTG